MKKNTKIIMLVMLLMGMAGSVSAQYTFVVDAIRGDSTALYSYNSEWKDTWVHLGDAVGAIPNGTEVTIASGDTVSHIAYFNSIRKGKEFKKHVVAVTYDGTQYLVADSDLMLSPNDTSGKSDFINKTKNRHEGWAHWYCTYTPYIIILVLLVLATVLAAISYGEIVYTILVPLLLLAAIFLEVMGVLLLGSDMLWWVDKDHFAMGIVIFRLILFAVAIVLQIFSIRLYKNSLADDADDLNVRRPIISAVIGAVLFLVCILLNILFKKTFDGQLMFHIGLILLGISLLIGIIITAVQNCRAIGFWGGLAFTLFAIIYGIGFIVAVTMLIIGVVNAFMEMIVTIGGAIIVLIVMSKIVPSRSYTRSDGTRVEVYEDFHV